MGATSRGVRNLARNPTRSLLVATLIALSVAIVVATAAAGAASGERAQALRSQTATLIQVNPAGAAPGGGSSAALPTSLRSSLANVEGVAGVNAYVRRQFSDNSQQVAMGVVNGAEPGSELRLSSMGSFTGTPRLVAGRTLQAADADRPVAVVGRVFAEQRELQVGSSFTLPARLLAGPGQGGDEAQPADLEAQVVGIYSVDVAFGDNQLFVPLSVAQTALGQSGQVSQFWVQAQTADQVPAVQKQLKRLLSRQQVDADVVASTGQAQAAAASLDAVGANATLAAVVATLAGGVTVGSAMVLVTRERRREIAVLKALGAGNRHVAAQFVAESVALAALGGLLGTGLAVAAGPALAQVLLGADQLSALQVGGAAAATGVGLALVFGVLGSLYPVRRALRLQPAQALRPVE